MEGCRGAEGPVGGLSLAWVAPWSVRGLSSVRTPCFSHCERKYEEVCDALEAFYGARDASEKKAVQKEHSQVYAWVKKYERGKNVAARAR